MILKQLKVYNNLYIYIYIYNVYDYESKEILRYQVINLGIRILYLIQSSHIDYL